MATKKAAKTAVPKGAAQKPPRKRRERRFPALTFEEALVLSEAIQRYASGQQVRRLTLFEKLDKSPDSLESRKLITASGQYGLTKGGYMAEHLGLTPEGIEATGEDVLPEEKLEARFNLAIKNQAPFSFLYQKLKGAKMPVREVMADYLAEAEVEEDERAECIDTFIVNAKFLGLLRTIAGSERLIPIEQALEEAQSTSPPTQADASNGYDRGANASNAVANPRPTNSENGTVTGDFAKICFYITPIGEDGSEERRHADFLMEYVIKPAVKEFDLTVVRADQMGKPGMIGKQVVEHILKARLVIADLSFHNPNVFYELSLRHATRLPTVQVKRTIDKLPFDLKSVQYYFNRNT
jgi:hypothetical protein